MRKLGIACLAAAAAFAAWAPAGAAAAGDVDAAFARFWSARTPDEAAAVSADIIASGVSFDDAWTRLRHGRAYSNTVPHGLVRLRRKAGGLEFPYNVEVPDTYDPARQYQVRVQLHGGVMGRDAGEQRDRSSIGALAGVEQIYVLPFAWRDAPWWSPLQEENLSGILDSVRRTWNIDENRVALAGVSDGATSTLYMGMRNTTPFSSFLSLNGNIMVLANDRLVSGGLSPNNLLNKPLFVVNGGMDPLYPAAGVGPFFEHLKKHGVQVDYSVQPTGVHNTQWWPWVKDSFEAFVHDHPRNPYPDRLTWETDRADIHNRADWLVIDSLRASPGDTPMADVNEFDKDLMMTFGVVGIGTRVSAVLPGSDADKFGLRPGDMIVSVNGRAMRDAGALSDLLQELKPGYSLRIVATRDGDRFEAQGPYQPVKRKPILMFSQSTPPGRVDLERAGNTIEARTRGVGSFTLLLSPDMIDFSQPVKVLVNGNVAFDGRVERSLTALLKWAARDNDRTMLFGAELHLTTGSQDTNR